MLSEYFNLTHLPFTDGGDLRGLFESPAFEETYEELLLGILDGRRMQLLVGPSGAGRTCMLARVRGGLQATELHVVAVSQPTFSLEELLAVLNAELADLPAPEALGGASGELVREPSPREELARRLAGLRESGHPVVLLIDDAEALGSAVLNQLPGLLARAPGTAMERSAGSEDEPAAALAQVVLAVEPDFVQRLPGVELDSLNAAIDGVLQLAPWDRTTVTDYVCAAVEAASGLPGEVFTEDALEAVFVHSEGIPGRVNALCAGAMHEAKAQGKRRVTAEHVSRVLMGSAGAEFETGGDRLVAPPPVFTLEPSADARSRARETGQRRPQGREHLGAAAGALAEGLRRWGARAADPSQRRALAALGLGAVAVVTVAAVALVLRPSGPGAASAPAAVSTATRPPASAPSEPARIEALADQMDTLSRQLVSVEARLRGFETDLVSVKQTVHELRDRPGAVLASAAEVAVPRDTAAPSGPAPAPPTARAEATAPPPAAAPTPAPSSTPRKSIIPMATGKSGVYTVQHGDTLWGIARREGTTVASLATLNHLPKDTALRAGQTLHLHEPPAPRWYTVQRGDSLYSIGKRFSIAPARLADWNCLGREGRIFPGQRISVQEPTADHCATNRG